MKIAIVGEAWGKDEEIEKHAFVGQSGLELARMLFESGLSLLPPPQRSFVSPHDMTNWWPFTPFALFNVLNFRPESISVGVGNNFDALLVKKELGAPGWPQISQGKYMPAELIPEVEKLHLALAQLKPDLILALGNKACWALLKSTKITALRGTPVSSPWGKVLPTYHPAAVLRNWSMRPIVVKDLEKAKRESAFREVRRPEREIHIAETIQDIRDWIRRELIDVSLVVSCDIETAFNQITCIGFSARPECALVIPFVDKGKPDWSYWNDSDEKLAWELVQSILGGPWRKVGQNFLYDLQYLLHAGILPRNCTDDTMLLHHSLYPEMQKSLGFLGSIYTQEPAWKLMRGRGSDTEKRDE